MTTDESPMLARLSEIRNAFDQTFAQPSRGDSIAEDDVLAIAVGGDDYAMRLTEIGGLYTNRKVTWLPGSIPELLGVVALRGALLPLYDLAALLGYGRAAQPRWFVVAASTHVALAFDHFEGHLRVPRAVVTQGDGLRPEPRSGPVREVVSIHGLARPLLHLPSVLDEITRLVDRGTNRRSDDR